MPIAATRHLPFLLIAALACLPVHARPSAPPPAPARLAAMDTAQAAHALQPFVASYQAYNKGKLAGVATMHLVDNDGSQWRVDLGIEGKRGMAGILGLNIQQSTVFDEIDGQYRPLTQSTVRKGLFLGREISGTYDWDARSARWTGDIKRERREPIALHEGDMSGLLINLAVIRDAQPGKRLQYRFVDGGRVREYIYQVAPETESVVIDDLRYRAMRVSRVNGGNDETIFWIANGVPTPVRILQRENGEDGIDLRLTKYRGAE